MFDEDDKTRRNLVAATAVVLLTHWLGLSFAEAAGKLLSGSSEKIDPIRALIASAAVLFYLALRFHTSTENKKAIAKLEMAVNSRLNEIYKAEITTAFRRFKKSGTDSHLIGDGLINQMRDAAKARQSKVLPQDHETNWDAAEIREFSVIPDDGEPQIMPTIKFVTKWPNPTNETAHTISTSATPTDKDIRGYVRRAKVYACVFSEAGLWLLWPYAFLTAAVFSIAARIIVQLLTG